jgi:hypothetical protein
MGLEWLFDALTPVNLVLAFAGVVCGIAIGAIPGLSATMAVAVLVPFTSRRHEHLDCRRVSRGTRGAFGQHLTRKAR